MTSTSPSRTITEIAHRGYAGIYPENTLGALRRACDAGADMLEVDVMPAADGTPVVFHDTTPGRVTGANGTVQDTPIWELPLESLRKLRVFDTDERIPLLSEVVSEIPPTVGLNVELKNPGSDEVRFGDPLDSDALAAQRSRWDSFAADVLDVLAQGSHEVLLSSFYEGALAAVQVRESAVALANVFSTTIQDGLTVARRYDCEAVHVPWNMIAGTPFFGDEYCSTGPFSDIDVVEVAHADGRDVNVWTIETWRQASVLDAAGVDGLIADYPGLHRFLKPVERSARFGREPQRDDRPTPSS